MLCSKKPEDILSYHQEKLLNHNHHISNDNPRLYCIIIVLFLFFCALGYRLLDISLFHGHERKKGMVGHHHTTNLRSDIVDRNNVLLATNLTTASLYANPKQILNTKEVAQKLHHILPELDYNQLVTDLNTKNKSFVWIKRNITPKEQYTLNSLGVPGLQFEQETKRIYPHGGLCSHILGFVGRDGNGLAGIEKQFDERLRHANQDNIPLTLSIDVRVQSIVNEELNNAIKEFRAIGGIGLVLNTKNGELLAAVSLPDFDPHNPGMASNDQLFNRFSLGLYEPGSIFKAYTMAMALDSNAITINDIYNVSSPIHVARFNITDLHPKGGWLSVPEIFQYSSNIGMAKISIDLGKKRQQYFLRNFGLLDQISELELPEKASPMYPNNNHWSDLSVMTISYGHGIALTPLHIIKAGAAIVNGGYLHPLTLLKREDEDSTQSTKIIKETTVKQMRKLLRLVVAQGTGKKANVKGYWVGGKTGTANKNQHGVYKQNARLSSFLATFPVYDPEYMVLIMIDEPKGNQKTGGFATASFTAAPTSARIIERIGPLLGINIEEENSVEIIEQLHIEGHNNLDADIQSF